MSDKVRSQSEKMNGAGYEDGSVKGVSWWRTRKAMYSILLEIMNKQEAKMACKKGKKGGKK